ncbi:MAG: hypothetical protein ACYSWQ_05090 [Planctomycetota bacterium]
MQQKHDILNSPFDIANKDGQIKVLKHRAKEQRNMGEALTLDSIVNSIDAELIATGPSAKGPNRGAIVRHGRYILWGFEGPVSNMTDSGQRLFVNTVCYAAQQCNSPVLENLLNGTRDQLYAKLDFAKSAPGYLNTIRRLYVPNSMQNATFEEIEDWVKENRPYLRVEGKRPFIVDEFAKELGIPNHTKAFLEKCIQLIEEEDDVEEAVSALARYTGRTDLGASASAWREWLTENRDYLYFSDSDGFRFKIDKEAKAKGIATADLRGWSSEFLDYRFRPNSKAAETSNNGIKRTR